MELNKINELMANRGYMKPIGAIFSEWEFVKDEILLPNRKAGSGNGTVHVYLLEDNMHLFKECFPEYIDAFNKNLPEAEELCPRIKHFVMTSNVLTVVGFAYHHYNCDANVFNYSDYVGKVMRHDDNGTMTFDSLFKLSTENRPYFKQFDKQVFGKIIRYIFVPRKTAYKLYLYGDEDYQNFAAFWIIGEIPDWSFIVQEENRSVQRISEKKEHEASLVREEEPIIKTPVVEIILTPEEVEMRFKKYMESLGKSERTVSAYAGCLRNLVPRAQKMIDGMDHPSPYTITDYAQLKALDTELWSHPEVVEWNKNDHNRCSAALHMYMQMFEDGFNEQVEIIAKKETVKKPKQEESRMDFTLTGEEEVQKDAYIDFLRKEKGMADVTLTSYTNTLLKRLSNLLRDYYRSDFRNVFSVTNYKELSKMEEEIWEIPKIVEANEKSKGKLTASFRAYTEFVESTLSDDELAEMIFGENSDEEEDETLVVAQIGKMQQFTTHLPLYSIRAACGKFTDDEEAEIEGWVNVENMGIKASEDMFVVHAKGHSMEPRIHDGDLCVFRFYQGGTRQDSIVLTELTSRDMDYGGMYTIKKYYSEKVYDEDGINQHSKVVLRSLNHDYDNIDITEEDASEMKTIGIFVDTIS